MAEENNEDMFEEIFQYVWPVFFAMCVILLFLSVSTITIIIHDLDLRRASSSAIFIANLASVDLFLAGFTLLRIFVVSFNKLMVEEMQMKSGSRNRIWIVEELQSNVFATICCLSLLSTFANSVDRYIYLKCSIDYYRIVTVSRSKFLVGGIWIFSILFGSFPMALNILNDQKGLSRPYSKYRIYGTFIPLLVMYGLCSLASEIMFIVLFVIVRRRRHSQVRLHLLPSSSSKSSMTRNTSASTSTKRSPTSVMSDNLSRRNSLAGSRLLPPLAPVTHTSTTISAVSDSLSNSLRSNPIPHPNVIPHTVPRHNDNNSSLGQRNNQSASASRNVTTIPDSDTSPDLINLNSELNTNPNINNNFNFDPNANSNTNNNFNSDPKTNSNLNNNFNSDPSTNSNPNNDFNFDPSTNSNLNNDFNPDPNNNTHQNQISSNFKNSPHNSTRIPNNYKKEMNQKPLEKCSEKIIKRRQPRFISYVREDFQTAKTLFVLLGVYILLWAPSYAIMLLSSIQISQTPLDVYLIFCYLLAILNSIIDFLVYPMRVQRIRKTFVNSLKKACRCFHRY